MKRIAVALVAVLIATALIASMLGLPAPALNLPASVSSQMTVSGVDHPVTAVLLNFRGYDTLLEIAVLLLALLGVLAVAASDIQATTVAPLATDAVLQAIARLAVPLMIIVATYLLWSGAYRSGGAFQAGAVLAAGTVLLNLVGLLPAGEAPTAPLRAGLTGGFLIFLAVAVAMLAQGALLQYPPAHASSLILLIEAGLTVSLGLILACLFLLMS